MIDQLITKYIALRDKKAALKRTFDERTAELTAGMDRIEAELAKHLTAAGVDRMGCGEGVAFFSTVRSAKVADGASFLRYLQESGNWSLADIRAAKKQIGEFRDEHDDLPPGIDWHEARVVRVNRN